MVPSSFSHTPLPMNVPNITGIDMANIKYKDMLKLFDGPIFDEFADAFKKGCGFKRGQLATIGFPKPGVSKLDLSSLVKQPETIVYFNMECSSLNTRSEDLKMVEEALINLMEAFTLSAKEMEEFQTHIVDSFSILSPDKMSGFHIQNLLRDDDKPPKFNLLPYHPTRKELKHKRPVGMSNKIHKAFWRRLQRGRNG